MQTAIWEKKHMVKSQNYLLQDTSSVIQPEAESGKTLQNKKQFHTILTLIVGKEKKKSWKNTSWNWMIPPTDAFWQHYICVL